MPRCLATACKKQAPEGCGMCGRHWRMVPYALRQRIWDSVGSSANRELWKEAVREVEKKEGIAALEGLDG